MKGIVIKTTGAINRVLLDNGEEKDCVIRGKLRLKGFKSTNPTAVGDEVELMQKGDEWVIQRILDRHNCIVRKSVNLSKQHHVIAANIDYAALIISIKEPETTFSFVDRFLLSAEAFGVPVILIINKIDLVESDAEINHWKEIYHSLVKQILLISVEKNIGINEVKDVFKNKTVLLSGHSGVGKSSLVNLLNPNSDLRTAPVSEVHSQGMHTTTHAEMVITPDKARLIDTPGIKGFGITKIEKDEVPLYFVDFMRLADHCHFHNCKHISEPKCAVKEALEEGEIAPSRYLSYLDIVDSYDEENFRQNIYSS